ncbi:hypothetical protein DOTSEDRAFT_75658 [Dothistroma septosporum NZE10]|uniref:Uncharacterized protein n=1 Tax=Dothistroma septosporum (strain NZE10 / CBS 128990) TaxID=675120 RepID=M2WJ85_DOTSN|nr:hypothetical protein DOTSEDRAFT_75658 [Dothistroma septosporum NZE10]
MIIDLGKALVQMKTDKAWHIQGYHEMNTASGLPTDQDEDEDVPNGCEDFDADENFSRTCGYIPGRRLDRWNFRCP